MIKGILIILLWLLVVPLGSGMPVAIWLKNRTNIVIKGYLFGLIVYLAIFQVIIIANMFTVNNFFQVCTVFAYITAVAATVGIIVSAFLLKKGKTALALEAKEVVIEVSKNKKIENVILWIMFGVIVLFQLIQAIRLTFPDGDDAYYVGTASFGVSIPQMYSRIPYTGATTQFDTRHCLAPFPYFIAFLSRMSGIEVGVIAHCILPVAFILFAYGIYYLIAKELCREAREVSLFMLVVSVLLMFGNYSVYSMETFLMTRIRQGKASLGGFAIPMGFYLLYMFVKKIEGKKQEKLVLALLLGCNGLVAALFTTMGNFIYPCMLTVGGLCICFGKKRWKSIFWIVLSCVPSVVMAALYFIIR